MRLCVFVWSSLTLPVLGELNPRWLYEEATSACVCVDPCAYDRIFVFSLAFYSMYVFWSWGLVCWQVVCVCQEGGGLGVGGQWPFWDRHKIRIWERSSERERGPLSCDSAFHQGTGRQRHKTRHASPPLRHSPHPSTTTTPALPSVPSLHPSPLSVTLTFIKKPHAGIPFQHLCVDARVQHVHLHTHTYKHMHTHPCGDIAWTWLDFDCLKWPQINYVLQLKNHF